jgi:hypothetical protein
MGDIAKSLVKLWEKHPEKIRDIYNEGGRGGSWNGPDYWMDLQPGWMNEGGGNHLIHEYNAADVLQAFKLWVKPCDMGEDGQPCCMQQGWTAVADHLALIE